MAQKDIEDIANYMKQIDESKRLEDEACARACKECEEQQAAEDDEFEDEVIDKESLGFIDDSAEQNESDRFYLEDGDKDPFEEDVTDCMEQEIAEQKQFAKIEIEVYNEDGFGKYFTKKLMKTVPGTIAVEKKTLSNGDLLVEVSGLKDTLEKAFAFYLGKASFAELDRDDKEDFESRLVFDDGDTIAEADYREAVAHCLDGVGVNASTANLAGQDTCAISLIKEEKIRRKAEKMVKALRENDFSTLSDDDLDTLDSIKDKIDSDAKLDAKDEKVWAAILKTMGYTPKEWNELPPEKREKIWDFHSQPMSKSMFGDGVHTAVDPKTGKMFRYRNSYEVTDPSTGEKVVTAFNPYYDMEHSIHQHPSAVIRQNKKDAEIARKKSVDQLAKDTLKNVRGRKDAQGNKDTWTKVEFAQIIGGLDAKQRKQLMNELIADVEKDNADNPRKAGDEIMVIKKMFDKKITLRDLAKAWGKTAPGVMKFADETIAIWQRSMREAGIKSPAELQSSSKFNAFKEALKKNLETRHKGSIVSGK